MLRLILIFALAVGAECMRGKSRKHRYDSQPEANTGSNASLAGSDDYNEWRKQYRSGQAHDPVSYEDRLTLFNERRARVAAHNARQDVTWKEAVNHLADWTPEEFQTLLGYRRGRSAKLATSLLEVASVTKPDMSVLAKTIDWRDGYETASWVKEQKACGSCWAVAAAGCLEMHAEKHLKDNNLPGSVPPLSFAQLVDCTENKDHCGGAGGCSGATGELGFAHSVKYGVASALLYTGKGDSTGDQDIGSHCTSHEAVHGVTVGGYTRLPVNVLWDLMHTVANIGPVVVSASASDWTNYDGGIYAGCGRDVIVNHAVLLMGYGQEEINGQIVKYWLIRNSWSDTWGDRGYMRILRHDGDISDMANGWCGMDTDNQEGVGCLNDPKVIPVCGMCGILSDSAYPVDVVVLNAVDQHVQTFVSQSTQVQASVARQVMFTNA